LNGLSPDELFAIESKIEPSGFFFDGV